MSLARQVAKSLIRHIVSYTWFFILCAYIIEQMSRISLYRCSIYSSALPFCSSFTGRCFFSPFLCHKLPICSSICFSNSKKYLLSCGAHCVSASRASPCPFLSLARSWNLPPSAASALPSSTSDHSAPRSPIQPPNLLSRC